MRFSSSIVWASSAQRTASTTATGIRNQRRREHGADGDCKRQAAKKRSEPRQRGSVRVNRSDGTSAVDLDERTRSRGLNHADAQQRERGPDDGDEERERAGRLTGGVDAEQTEAAEEERLDERDDGCRAG